MIRRALQACHFGKAIVGILFVIAVFLAQPVAAETTVAFPADAVFLDLVPHGTQVAAQRRNVALEVPGETEGTRMVLELRGAGPGPDFNWTIYSVQNPSDQPRSLVLNVPMQRLAASGFLLLKPFGSQVVAVNWAKPPQALQQLPTATGDAYGFVMAPNSTLTFAVEGAPALRGIGMFDAHDFAIQQSSVSFFNGASLAVAAIISMFLLALYGIRSESVFVSAGWFGLACLQFMCLESGYLDGLASRPTLVALTPQHLRAASEIWLASGFALAALTLSAPNRRKRVGLLLGLLLLGSAMALLVLSAYNPLLATVLARVVILLSSVLGFCLALYARQNNAGAMDNGMLLWSAILLWLFLAVFSDLSQSASPTLQSTLLVSLATVLAILALALARFAFAQGYLSNYYLTDATRRSLALAGAQHFLWDWMPAESLLEVGGDLAKSLGYDPARFEAGKAARMFASIMHPSDEHSYFANTGNGNTQNDAIIEQELRLKDAEGNYHWFVLKARALPGVGPAPERLIGTLTDITRSKQHEDRLMNEAVKDPVTGLPSRAIFMDRLEREIEKPLGLPLRVILIAIERFKVLNDGLGHDLGDQLLLVAGQRIADALKSDETLTRISGSMFAVMFIEEMAGRNAVEFAETLLDVLGRPMPVASQDVYLRPSIGISGSSANGHTATELQRQAASALHHAQQQGSRSVKEYDDTMTDERAEDVALEADLRRAIDRHEIEVHYQPIIHLASGSVAGFEALARWNHPEFGALAPAEFIGLAEEAGLITEIGDLILSEAGRQMGIWQRTLTRDRPVYVAVNVSQEQLSDTKFFDKLASVIDREGLAPQSLKVELTESVVMRYPERAKQLITKLRTMGVGVACDDFGTGFSNLASLRDLHFDTLKIDKSFIVAGALDGRGGLILSTVIELAHSLGMTVVAEGIEEEQQADMLFMLGCDLGQGYLLGEAKPAREQTSLLSIFPVVTETVVAPVAEIRPVAKVAFPEPRKPLWPRELFDLPKVVVKENADPEELPSIFKVQSKTPSAKRKSPAAKKSNPKKPDAKSVRAKAKKSTRRR